MQDKGILLYPIGNQEPRKIGEKDYSHCSITEVPDLLFMKWSLEFNSIPHEEYQSYGAGPDNIPFESPLHPGINFNKRINFLCRKTADTSLFFDIVERKINGQTYSLGFHPSWRSIIAPIIYSRIIDHQKSFFLSEFDKRLNECESKERMVGLIEEEISIIETVVKTARSEKATRSHMYFNLGYTAQSTKRSLNLPEADMVDIINAARGALFYEAKLHLITKKSNPTPKRTKAVDSQPANYFSDKNLLDIWEGSKDHYEKVIRYLHTELPGIDAPLLRTTNGKTEVVKRFGINKFIAAFIQTCIEKSYIKQLKSAEAYRLIISNTFNLTMRDSADFDPRSRQSLDKKYLQPFQNLPY
jgi:hypothetical protein